MAHAAAAAVVAGTAYQIYANEKATQEKEKAALEEAQAREAEANEIAARYEINRKSLEKDYTKYKGDVEGAYIKAGLDVGTAPLYLLEQVHQDYIDEQYNMRRESLFKTQQLYQEGSFLKKQAKGMENIGRMQSYGQLLQGAGQVAGIYANRR